MHESKPTMSVLAYEEKQGERRWFWHVGNVSVMVGATLLLTIWIGVPALSLGEGQMQEVLAPFGVAMFGVWLVGPVVGVVLGIVGIARRVGRSAVLGVVLNAMCWPLLVILCLVSLVRGR